MTKLSVAVVSILLCLVSACSTSVPRGTEVTRFHLDEPIPAQTINMEPANPGDSESLEYRNYADVVKTQLANAGFSVVDGNDADVFAIVSVTRGIQQKNTRSSSATVGIGGGSYGGNIGIGGGVSFPVGGSPSEFFATTLEVRLIDRSENAVIWEGQGLRAKAAAEESPLTSVQKIAAAMFRDFPGESGKTVVVDD